MEAAHKTLDNDCTILQQELSQVNNPADSPPTRTGASTSKAGADDGERAAPDTELEQRLEAREEALTKELTSLKEKCGSLQTQLRRLDLSTC